MIRLRGSGTLVGLAALVAGAIGASVTLFVLPEREPASLATASPATVVPVTTRRDADERQVQLSFDTGAPRAVVAPRAGVLTELDCVAGGAMHSGDRIARIDGSPVVALATSTPLWRDIVIGDTGADVRSLQSELARMGSRIAVDGIAGRSTIRAAAATLRTAGLTSPPSDRVSLDLISWIPAAETTVRSCVGTVGVGVDQNDTLVDLPSELRSARLEQVPVEPVSGQREVQVGEVRAPIADGIVHDATALAEIAGTAEYAAAVGSSDAPSTTATWRLAEPLDVSVIPPTAVWGIRDGVGCVRAADDRGRRHDRRVEVVGSQLGQTFVRVHGGDPIRSVVAQPSGGGSCP